MPSSRSQSRSQSRREMRLNSGNSTELTALQELIRRGPLTVVLVFTTTCPHCKSYMPLWRELSRTPGRQASMVSMEAATYDKTPLASQKPVSGVPTVLFVDTEGRVSEAAEPRNRTVMTNVLRTASPAAAEAPAPAPADDMFEPVSAAPVPDQELQARMSSVLPGSEVAMDTLDLIPGQTQQQGGSPWAAFLQAAAQAAPAAALLGAYSVLPRRRRRTVTSSGLPRLGGGRRRRTQRRSRKQK